MRKGKKLKTDGILFCGQNSKDVTGSCIYIRYAGKQILLECGLYQSASGSYLDAYNINSKKFRFKPEEIDYVFINHCHIDHLGLLPRLIKEGFKGKIIINSITSTIGNALLRNSSYILEDEARILSKRYKRNYLPIYDIGDVERVKDFYCIYDGYDKIFELDENVKFQWLTNSHCIGACQLQLILNNGINTKKILYTSDIGSLNSKNHYVKETHVPDFHNDVVIMESTYGEVSRATDKSREFDVRHIETAVDTVIGRGGSLIFPVFSFARTQEILSTLYDSFGQNKDFRIPIIVDSLLSCEICELYNIVLDDFNYNIWKKVYNWENVRFVTDKTESRGWIANSHPKIVLSSSGFCSNGRVTGYLEKYLCDKNSMIVFSGYVGDNPSYLSYRIKNGKLNSEIKINRKKIPNKADAISLSTFSSHANFKDLIEYGSNLKTEKLVLVHGSKKAKENLSKDLKNKISKNDKTYKVISSEIGMILSL